MFDSEIIKNLKCQNLALLSPQIVLFGRITVKVEGHKGVVYFSDTEIRFRLKDCYLQILGGGLSIRNVSGDGAIVEGEIVSVSYA